MSEYGVTKQGFVKMRLDEIISETQADLTEGFGFDVSLNPQSFLNVLVTATADRFARLWEVAEQVYFSKYPSTAEGVNLDNAAQYGGVTRDRSRKTTYSILCTGKDGTAIPAGTRIASNTLPKIYFSAPQTSNITRELFNKAKVLPVSVESNASYYVTINGNTYSVNSGSEPTKESILTALRDAITEPNYTISYNSDMGDTSLSIECQSDSRVAILGLSDNLTTEYVSTIITFQSEEFGKVVLPLGAITEIVTTVAGFESCSNVATPVYGRIEETDAEFRQSYLQKMSSRSTSTLESIVAAILKNVDNVSSATAYENDGNEPDAEGRPPKSIEVIVDGGNDDEIASQILSKKTAGIGTYGTITVEVPDAFGGTIPISFNRPESVYLWLKVQISEHPSKPLPDAYADLIKSAILDCVSQATAAEHFFTQDLIQPIKESCPGIAYIDILAYDTTDNTAVPTDEQYTKRNVYITSRQKVAISEDRIGVVLSEN